MKCIKCGRTGRDTRMGICDLCAFTKGKPMAKKRKTPARDSKGRFKKKR